MERRPTSALGDGVGWERAGKVRGAVWCGWVKVRVGAEGVRVGKRGGVGKSGGFVLLEILMAIALFSTVSVAMVQALGQIADTSMVARRETLMVGRLESAIAEAGNRGKMEEGEWETERDGFGIAVRTEVVRAEIENREGVVLEGIWQVRVEVEWSDGVRREVRNSETYVNEKLADRGTEPAR